MRSGPGAARTILLFHIISAWPSKQPLMARTFLKVYGTWLLFFVSARTNKRHHHHHQGLRKLAEAPGERGMAAGGAPVERYRGAPIRSADVPYRRTLL